MKIKLSDLLNAQKALNTLGEAKGLKASTAFTIARNIRAINPELEAYNTQYKAILDQYALKDDKGEVLIEDERITLTNAQKYTEEVNDLLEVEVDIAISPVNIDDLEGADLTPIELMNIDFMIKTEEEDVN